MESGSSDRIVAKEYKLTSEINFILLSIASFGLYNIWWMFKAWRLFRERENSDIIPVARAIFAIFFLLSLLNKISDFSKSKGYPAKYNSLLLFLGYFIFSGLSNLPEPYWLIGILGFIFFLPAVKAFNFAMISSPEYNVQVLDSFSTKQLILLILVLVFWILVLNGLLMEDPS